MNTVASDVAARSWLNALLTWWTGSAIGLTNLAIYTAQLSDYLMSLIAGVATSRQRADFLLDCNLVPSRPCCDGRTIDLQISQRHVALVSARPTHDELHLYVHFVTVYIWPAAATYRAPLSLYRLRLDIYKSYPPRSQILPPVVSLLPPGLPPRIFALTVSSELQLLGFCLYFFPYFFVSGPCARLSWPSRQLLSAHVNLPYRIVSYRILWSSVTLLQPLP